MQINNLYYYIFPIYFNNHSKNVRLAGWQNAHFDNKTLIQKRINKRRFVFYSTFVPTFIRSEVNMQKVSPKKIGLDIIHNKIHPINILKGIWRHKRLKGRFLGPSRFIRKIFRNIIKFIIWYVTTEQYHENKNVLRNSDNSICSFANEL